jgi:hypothetical protein
MKYAIEMASGGMIYERVHANFHDSSSIGIILRLLPQQFERFQCWYYRWEVR